MRYLIESALISLLLVVACFGQFWSFLTELLSSLDIPVKNLFIIANKTQLSPDDIFHETFELFHSYYRKKNKILTNFQLA